MSIHLFINKLYTVDIQKGQMQKLAGLLTESEMEELDSLKVSKMDEAGMKDFLPIAMSLVGSLMGMKSKGQAIIPSMDRQATTNKQMPAKVGIAALDNNEAGIKAFNVFRNLTNDNGDAVAALLSKHPKFMKALAQLVKDNSTGYAEPAVVEKVGELAKEIPAIAKFVDNPSTIVTADYYQP